VRVGALDVSILVDAERSFATLAEEGEAAVE
jgi:hypothetical protein